MRPLIALLAAVSLCAQTANPVADAQQVLADVQYLTTQLAAANATIAILQPQAAFTAQLNAACPTCQSVIAYVIGTQTNLAGTQICCGPSTVPPSPVALPPGYALIVIGPQLQSGIVTTTQTTGQSK